MKTMLSVLLAIVCCAPVGNLAAQCGPVSVTPLAPDLRPGSKVFLADMNGFETSLRESIQKIGVPVVLVASKEEADFVISGTASLIQRNRGGMFHPGPIHGAASLSVNDARSDSPVYGTNVKIGNSRSGLDSVADECAARLKKHIMTGRSK